jgi:hypothetical protein
MSSLLRFTIVALKLTASKWNIRGNDCKSSVGAHVSMVLFCHPDTHYALGIDLYLDYWTPLQYGPLNIWDLDRTHIKDIFFSLISFIVVRQF